MQLTHRWALRSLAARGDSEQAIFGIVQGASYQDLRIESARVISEMPFDGYAIGGLAVGESRAQREDCTATVTELLPRDRPRYLMGVGTTRDLLEAVHRGVECSTAFCRLLWRARAWLSPAWADAICGARPTGEWRAPSILRAGVIPAEHNSIAYLFHLQRVHETAGWQLLGLHNIHF